MKKTHLTLIVIALVMATFAFDSCKKSDSKTTPSEEFVANDSTFKDFMTWTLVKTNQGPDPALGGIAHSGNDSSVKREVYIKNNQKANNGVYPVGTLVVKHSYNPTATVNEYTAMVKRGNGFNPAGGDWEYFVLMMDGTIATDNGMKMRGADLMSGMCRGCHSAATTDHLFSQK
ncbi:MAG: hypothetical protein KG003_14025 [Bacteroidetes bacterium]|nr:hypothetical protein [Bacteroidota bacterium]